MALRRSLLSIQPGPTLATVMVAVSAVGFGLVPIFARGLIDAGIAVPAIAFYRFAFTAALLLPFLMVSRDKRPAMLMGFGCGLIMGLGWIGYVHAVKVAPIALAGVIYMTYPLFAVLFAWIILGQRPAGRTILAALMILGAAALALSPGSIDPEVFTALLISFAAPIGFGLGIPVLAGKLWVLSLPERMVSALSGSVVGLAPLVLSLDIDVVVPSRLSDWLLIAGLSIGTAMLPQFLYVFAVPKVGAARAAMAGSFELPTMFLVGWLAFGEEIGVMQMIAGGLVILAIVITPPIKAPASS